MNLKKFFKNQFRFSWDGFADVAIIPFCVTILWLMLHFLVVTTFIQGAKRGDAEMWPNCEAVYLGTYTGYHPIAGVNWVVIKGKYGETREVILTEEHKNSLITGEKIYFVSVRMTREASYYVVSEEEARKQIAQKIPFFDLTKEN